MMTKATWTLLILLGIQVVIILLLDSPCSSGYYRETSGDSATTALFPAYEKELAASIKIEKGEQSITLEKGSPPDTGWFLLTADNRYAAEQFSVDTLLTSVSRLKKLDVVSRNPEKAPVYELDDASAITLTILSSSGEELVNLLVGKNLGALRGTYVKLPGEDAVYLQLENIRRCCDKGEEWLDGWRDKTVFTCGMDEITRVEVDGPEGKAVMEFRPSEDEPEIEVEGEGAALGPRGAGPKGTWWMVQPEEGKIKEWEGRRLMEVIANMKAQGFAKAGQGIEDLGLDEPEATIVATLNRETGDTQLKITLSKEDEGSRYLILNDDPSTIYKVANYQFYAFLRKPDELLDKPPEPVKEEAGDKGVEPGGEKGAGDGEEGTGEEKKEGEGGGG